MKKIFSLIFIFTILVACGEGTNENAEISAIIKDAIGVEPYLPKTEYEVASVIIEYNPEQKDGQITKGTPRVAKVYYQATLDNKIDEEFMQAWEEEHILEEVVYGDLYMDPVTITVEIGKDGIGELGESELIEVEGHPVQYQYVDRDIEAVLMIINFEKSGYFIQYTAKVDDIEADAKEFAKDLIKNN